MTVREQIYSVELNKGEIEIIVNAIHAAYQELKCMVPENQSESRKTYERMQPLRELRNSFASLIGRSFMGEDA